MPKPRIACFHGSGSNASIYEIQCSFLSTLLADTFTLEFFDGPFLRSAGPGVLPAFADYGPYKSWFDTRADRDRDRYSGDGSGYDELGRDGVERVWRLMEERAAGDGGEWVGVMGFSQGSRVAGGLLLDQQRRKKEGDTNGVVNISVQFGVLCMGGGAPMESEVAYKLSEPDNVVRIPTLHMHGLKDEFLQFGREQHAKYFDRDTATLYEINYHHAMPWVKAEAEELARLIKEMYAKTKGPE
ncbi:serine hydrolase FSH [Aspergillus cavernicola]|uniref:Serine hydrolase FSH n=1 Tax=Aspergillus cavernicola TaxID=176166 RepID=A0ABR4I986_9EURO